MRAIVFCAIFLLGLYAPLPVFLIGVIAYTMVWSGIELISIAAFIDMQFGITLDGVHIMYTSAVGAVVCIAYLVKPFIRFYTKI